ncbi:hypothetical protein QVD17_36261 [Tagetes erecta]|uniref:PABS domain-containing protein n=1 Tax=Tagetes erecta TaxID=13708 RepID=A0AAD8JSD2_TARER|nr:hypothetical protein QVD17_36261 [Tagetes erecta]
MFADPDQEAKYEVERFYKEYKQKFEVLLIDTKDFKDDVFFSPTTELAQADVIAKYKSVLSPNGILLMHLHPVDHMMLDDVKSSLEECFSKVIIVKVTKKSYVAFAAVAPVDAAALIDMGKLIIYVLHLEVVALCLPPSTISSSSTVFRSNLNPNCFVFLSDRLLHHGLSAVVILLCLRHLLFPARRQPSSNIGLTDWV